MKLSKEQIITGKVTESLDMLNSVLDSLTDDSCEPLPNTDAVMVNKLKAIGYKLFDLEQNYFPEHKGSK